jgi:hypothetical protein
MSSELQIKCENTITKLIEKYQGNDYILQRIHNHIVNYLPNTLEYENNNYEKRLNRNTYLTNEKQIFIQVFLNKNLYFYLPSNNCFYEYNGKNYFIIKEDDIIHKLLSSISKDRVLLQWKYKTKINIIKQIKERSLFNSIPESETIQNVLNVLYPSFFTSKNQAKYFLTIIGDNIFKKNQNFIFLINSSMKKILCDLDTIASFTIGMNNLTHNFMTKYHENHSYDKCRLIKINDTFSYNLWVDLLKKIGLDLLCVSTHYSIRYENSDNFIECNADEELKLYTNYIKNNNHSNILKEFCSKYICETSNDIKIEWKNLHFVWKQFLSDSHFPNMIYSNTLKNLMKEKYNYEEETDSFIGITSKFLPIERDFIKFWELTISTNNNSNSIFDNDNNYYSFDNEIEVDELCSLFKIWSKQTSEQLMTNGNISEQNILRILKHFFPNIEIIEDKYILNISSTLWDKILYINDSFKYMQEEIKKESNVTLLSFEDAYNYYYKFCTMNSCKLVVSKRYFEKYLYYKISDSIVYEKFIEASWILNF